MSVPIEMLRSDPKRVTRLACRKGGVDVVRDGVVVFRLWIPHTKIR